MAKAAKKTIISRIERRRRALAPKGKAMLSERAASLLCGLPPDGIRTLRRQIEEGKQSNIRSSTLAKLASGLQTTVQWLLNEEGPETTATSAFPDGLTEPGQLFESGQGQGATVPLVGFVRAGAEAVYLPLNESVLDRVPAPENATELTRALEVRGDSLGELFDRWLVFFNDEHRQITPDLVNKLCVLELEDGRTLVKRIRRVGAGEYELLSNTEPPIRGAKIVWAARVISMRPQ